MDPIATAEVWIVAKHRGEWSGRGPLPTTHQRSMTVEQVVEFAVGGPHTECQDAGVRADARDICADGVRLARNHFRWARFEAQVGEYLEGTAIPHALYGTIVDEEGAVVAGPDTLVSMDTPNPYLHFFSTATRGFVAWVDVRGPGGPPDCEEQEATTWIREVFSDLSVGEPQAVTSVRTAPSNFFGRPGCRGVMQVRSAREDDGRLRLLLKGQGEVAPELPPFEMGQIAWTEGMKNEVAIRCDPHDSRGRTYVRTHRLPVGQGDEFRSRHTRRIERLERRGVASCACGAWTCEHDKAFTVRSGMEELPAALRAAIHELHR